MRIYDLRQILYLGLSITFIGCQQPAMPAVAGPLTVDAWQEMEPPEKYDPATFDRLRMHNPKLQSEQEWELFMRRVVIPERNADMPDSIPGLAAR